MACGEDNRFSAIYSSIEGDEYEEYVEITNGPTAYLVPNKVPPRGELKAGVNKLCNMVETLALKPPICMTTAPPRTYYTKSYSLKM